MEHFNQVKMEKECENAFFRMHFLEVFIYAFCRRKDLSLFRTMKKYMIYLPPAKKLIKIDKLNADYRRAANTQLIQS